MTIALRLRTILCVWAVFVATPLTANAGVQVLSQTTISNVRVYIEDTGETVAIGRDVLPPSIFQGSANSIRSNSDGVQTNVADTDPRRSANAVFSGGGAYAENDFTPEPPGVSGNYMRADNAVRGAIFDFVPDVNSPRSGTTYTEAGADSIGEILASTSFLTENINFNAARSFDAIFAFDYVSDLAVSDDIGILDFGAARATLQLVISGRTQADPLLYSRLYSPLNELLFRVDSRVSTRSRSGTFLSSPFPVDPGVDYSFQFEQVNQAFIVPVVPEPATFATFAFISVIGMTTRRRGHLVG